MSKLLLHIAIISIMAASCSKKSFICPAYNSYFIHDNALQSELFAPFTIDSLSALESGNATASIESKGNGKYHPKEYNVEKQKQTGLLTKWKSNKPRNVKYIEMHVLAMKGQSRYSNIDSSSIINANSAAESDTL